METNKRRQVLETIAASDEAAISDKLRALDLLDKLDAHPDADPDFLAWKTYAGLSDEQLARELEALRAPVTTGPCRDDDERFWGEVEGRAETLAARMTAELRRERHELRKALAAAEARLAAATQATPSSAPRSAPSASGMAPSDDRPLRIVKAPQGIDLAEGWSKPSQGPVLTSFERKVRGFPKG